MSMRRQLQLTNDSYYLLYRMSFTSPDSCLLDIIIAKPCVRQSILRLGSYTPSNIAVKGSTKMCLMQTLSVNLWQQCMLLLCSMFTGWVNEFLSWPGFVPVSRMTYCAYLVHPVIMVIVNASMKSLVAWSEITYVSIFLSLLWLRCIIYTWKIYSWDNMLVFVFPHVFRMAMGWSLCEARCTCHVEGSLEPKSMLYLCFSLIELNRLIICPIIIFL